MYISQNIKFLGVSPYIFWAAVGLVLAAALFLGLIKKDGMKLRLPFFLLVSSFLGMITGARCFSAIASEIYFRNTGRESHGGLVFYGGLFGFLAVYYILQKIMLNSENAGLWDAAAVIIPLFHAFGRIGCGFSGCCFGIECSRIFVSYADGIKRFPVQFLGAACEFLIFLVLLILAKRRKFCGSLIKIYLTVYPIGRFFIEFLRGDGVRGMIGNFSFGQVCSVVLLAAMLIIQLKRRYEL